MSRGAAVAAIIVVCAAVVAAAQPLFDATQDPLAGSRVFGVKGCARCHAVKGVGGTVGPDLGRTERARSFYDLAAALWNHAPRMADRMRALGIQRPTLDARESGDLVAFLFTVDYFDQPGNPDAGRRVFTEQRCVACHQVRGAGGVVGPSLDAWSQQGTPIALAAAMWNHSPRMAEVMAAKGIARPRFKGSELRDLIAYVDSLSSAPREEPLHVLPGSAVAGRRLFADKGCARCHSAGGQGGRAAPDLAERRASGSLTDFAAAMWNKAPVMLAAMKTSGISVPELKPSEMADILAYLYSVRYLAGRGDVAKGRAVAGAKGCLGCHGIGGGRGKPGGDLSRARGVDTPAGALAALWNHSFIGDATPGRVVTAPMTGGEMADLIAFLQSARRPR